MENNYVFQIFLIDNDLLNTFINLTRKYIIDETINLVTTWLLICIHDRKTILLLSADKKIKQTQFFKTSDYPIFIRLEYNYS